MPNSKLPYCAQIVQEHDPDRFLLSMLCPADNREALWALFAFNHEIAKTREVVSETQLGLIRLQWWRDAIGKIYEDDEILEHETLKPLAAAIKSYNLSREHFDKLIYAREFDLEDTLPGNIEGLINYADFTTTPLNQLALSILGDNESEPVQAVSLNYALTGLIRAVPTFAKHRRCLLPEDLLHKHGQKLNQLYEFKTSDQFTEIIKEISTHIVPGIKTDSRFLKASQSLSEIYLKQIKHCKYDSFSPRIAIPPPFKTLRILVKLCH